MTTTFRLAFIALLLAVTAAGQTVEQPRVEFDHLWIMVSPNAPERAALERAGFLIAKTVNRHEGQGTASITVEFQNAFLELMWRDAGVAVEPSLERAAEKFRQRSLWRTSGWCPIGIGFRPTSETNTPFPFSTWQITAPWMPAGSSREMLTPRDDTSSPSLFVVRRTPADTAEQKARAAHYQHPIGVERITAVRVVSPKTYEPIDAISYLQKQHAMEFGQGDDWLVELTFDSGRQKKSKDLRPDLPLIVRY